MKKKKVLIVDDDARNIFALKATLKSKSFECISSPDAAGAIELLKTNEAIDVVLIDMMMPDMDGYEAIPIIKGLKERQNMPVIAVTAQAMLGDREKCLQAGADDYVSKPINVDHLLQILHNI
jgi:CheY-like chemotaxis protein